MRRIAVLDAPSNLGLRPPTVTSVPGCAKAPGALRDQGLLSRLGARDAGCLTPPRYDPGEWRPGDGVAHAPQIAAYSRALADRIGGILDAGEFPVVLGGDCSILLGSGLAMHRLGESVGGRIGLVFVDGHSDFRHPGNASYVGAAAGEDLALVTGRGQADLAAIEGRRPYFRDIDVVVLGIRAQDEYRLDLQAAGIVTRPVPALRVEGAARSAQWARDQLVDCAGYWVHVDVDVLDPAVMPAVDAPSPGGIAFPELEILLAGLVESPHCLGVEITVFDPDYDPDGTYAAEITTAVTDGLAAAKTVALRPDLVAARADLSAAGSEPAGRTSRGVVAEAAHGAEGESGYGAADDTDEPAYQAAGESAAGEAAHGRAGEAAYGAAGADAYDAVEGSGYGAVGEGSAYGAVDEESAYGAVGEGSAYGAVDEESAYGAVGSEYPYGSVSRLRRGAAGESSRAAADEERERAERRAAAAGASVSLAAAGISAGPENAPGEIAVPATTVLGVEEASERADTETAWARESGWGDVGWAEARADEARADEARADEAREDAARLEVARSEEALQEPAPGTGQFDEDEPFGDAPEVQYDEDEPFGDAPDLNEAPEAGDRVARNGGTTRVQDREIAVTGDSGAAVTREIAESRDREIAVVRDHEIAPTADDAAVATPDDAAVATPDDAAVATPDGEFAAVRDRADPTTPDSETAGDSDDDGGQSSAEPADYWSRGAEARPARSTPSRREPIDFWGPKDRSAAPKAGSSTGSLLRRWREQDEAASANVSQAGLEQADPGRSELAEGAVPDADEATLASEDSVTEGTLSVDGPREARMREIPGGTEGDGWGDGRAETDGLAEDERLSDGRAESGGGAGRLVVRPLGQAPLLDSEPLPATRPGMLRPRAEEPAPEGFSLPLQRPAFDLGTEDSAGEPADIA